MEEKQRLVDTEESQASGYGADNSSPPAVPKDTGSDATMKTTASKPGNGQGKKQQKPPSNLNKVDEDVEQESKEATEAKSTSFGVRSYLHQFYDSYTYKDPRIYEEDEYHYLLPLKRRRICNSIWWKVFVWIGVNFLVFGIIGVLVGYLVPPRPVIIAQEPEENLHLIDNQAEMYNFNLDVCKLVGLALFCIGGLTLTLALLFPILLHQYCDDERVERPFRVSVNTCDTTVPGSPLEKNIPVTPQIANVQPGRNTEEAIVTQEGMVPVKE